MSKSRLLIPVTMQFSVRYVLRTGLLQLINEYAQPIVLLRWRDEELRQEIEDAGAEVHPFPMARFEPQYYRVRALIDVWHLTQLRSRSTAIDERRLNLQRTLPQRLRRQVRNALYRSIVAIPRVPDRLLEMERISVWRDTNLREFEEFLNSLKPDALFSLAPFFRSEQPLLYVAEKAGLPLCTAIISFDNITTRGWMPVIFDAYFLWNRHNEAELYRAYPEASSSQVVIVGAPQFDFYWDSSYLWDEQEWRQRLNIPANRPVILFGAGHHLIVPHEPRWLDQLDEAIENDGFSEKPIILFRRHPNDPLERWLPVLDRANHIIYDDPWPVGQNGISQTNVTRQDIERLASNLLHSQVHINASSTMTVDGAIFDRPQIGPAYDDRPGRKCDRTTRELYLREHYLPITNSGGLDIVYSRGAMIEAINSALRDPARGAEGRKRIVREICTYNDGRCTERVNQALKTFLASRASPPEHLAPSEPGS
jgi:hypothetical protein